MTGSCGRIDGMPRSGSGTEKRPFDPPARKVSMHLQKKIEHGSIGAEVQKGPAQKKLDIKRIRKVRGGGSRSVVSRSDRPEAHSPPGGSASGG